MTPRAEGGAGTSRAGPNGRDKRDPPPAPLSDAAFRHVVFGGNATILRPLKDPPRMPTEDVLTLLESRILGLSVDRLTTAASDSTIRKAQMPFRSDAQMPRSVKTAPAVLTCL